MICLRGANRYVFTVHEDKSCHSAGFEPVRGDPTREFVGLRPKNVIMSYLQILRPKTRIFSTLHPHVNKRWSCRSTSFFEQFRQRNQTLRHMCVCYKEAEDSPRLSHTIRNDSSLKFPRLKCRMIQSHLVCVSCLSVCRHNRS